MAEKKKYGDIEFNDQQMEEFRLVVPKYQVGVKINFFPSQVSLERKEPETNPIYGCCSIKDHFGVPLPEAAKNIDPIQHTHLTQIA